MQDPFCHYRFTQRLNEFSDRLDCLILTARSYCANNIPLEILDEIAVTIGELALVLSDHLALHRQTQDAAHSVISHAEVLRKRMRSGGLSGEPLVEAIGALIEEVHLILQEEKRAA
ncbi:MAG TPA: hypothetical protein VKB86_09370 [Pyrinomonadaceae bacterium]|nr:hypothetical protein [Pyrinomonadaceae bacterium]